MELEVNVIKENGIRKPDYKDNYEVVKDKGDTMIIKIDGMLEDRISALEELKLERLMSK